MTPYAAPKIKASQFTPKKPLDEYPRESVKKIAVLFTDIVGSSKYFKSYGDAAGRKMLRQHQELASPAVTEHGGIVVKLLGDSIMAYFSNPQEALKSAIKIQQKFAGFNQEKELRDQIHIRICVHFGDGIVEDNDIFGDVVNMAAKFLPLAGGNEVLISQELYEQTRGLSSLRFESVDVTGKTNILKGHTIYKVFWNEATAFDPYAKTLLYLKPVWELAESRFAKAWDSLVANKESLWEDKVEKENVLADKSMALIVKTPRSSLLLSKDIMEFLNPKPGEDCPPFLPLQIIIDSGSYVRADKLALEDLKVDWEEIKPGNIYISFSASKVMGASDTFSLSPKPDENHPQSFYKLTPNGQPQDDPYLFLYQNSLTQGTFPPCFYCSDRRHLTVNCPSKQLPGITHFIEKLGYLPLEEINKLFFNYLTKKDINIKYEAGSLNKTERAVQWAHNGFYELKMVFQQRFLRELWSTREDYWNRIKANRKQRTKGGRIWLGQDCIRVSKLDQAKMILSEALEKHPHDYRVHCALGFLNVGQTDFLQAQLHFSRALEHAQTRPQKILAHFLLARLCYLSHDLSKAQEHIKKILRLDPNCSEAIYQDIVFQFRQQKDTEALRRLSKLIRNERKYYVYALIDPDLADYNGIIHPELNNLLTEARDEARQIYEDAREKAQRLEEQLTPEEKEKNDPKANWLKIKELARSDSYFNYLDIIHYGSAIINLWPNYLEDRRRNLLKVLNKLRSPMDNYRHFVNNFPNRSLIGNVSRRLTIIRKKMDLNWDISRSNDPEKLKEAFGQAHELVKELMQVELELKKLNSTQHVLAFISQFFKKAVFFQVVNLIVAFGLFPIFAHYLNFFLPEVRITPQNIWEYQKIVLVLGSFSGLCLALMLTTKNMPDEQSFPVHF